MLTIDTSGNVGIGTTTPVSKLEVNGAIKASGITANIGTDPGVSLSYDTSNNIGLIETWTSKPLLTRTYNYQAFDISGSEKMRITSDGELLLKTDSLPTDLGDEKGQLVISSTDNAGANNYAVLQMQGHARVRQKQSLVRKNR